VPYQSQSTSRTDSFSENPCFRTFAHKHDTEGHAQITFALKPVIKELRIEQQVRDDRKVIFLNNLAAVASDMANIFFNVSRTLRGNIYHGMVIEIRLLVSFNGGGDSYNSKNILSMHPSILSMFMLNPSCKTPSHIPPHPRSNLRPTMARCS